MIRELTRADSDALAKLIKEIERNVINPKWWLTVKETARAHFFDKDWTVFYGYFDNGELIGASALFLNPFEYEESAVAANVSLDKTAEIGRCMVLPSRRGENIMYQLNCQLIKKAKQLGINTLIATAHPDNVASNQSLQKLGMKVVTVINKDVDFLRNVLVMNIDGK